MIIITFIALGQLVIKLHLLIVIVQLSFIDQLGLRVWSLIVEDVVILLDSLVIVYLFFRIPISNI